ncbi:hypothetical protein Tco_1319272 [Tanacetum coccineum]
MAGEDEFHDDNPPPPPPPVTPTQQAPHTLSTIKLPILKKGEYDIWAMKMEHYLGHTDYPIWEVIQKNIRNVEGNVDITEFFRKLKCVCHLTEPFKDLEWSNVPVVKLSSLSESNDTFSSLQALSNLHYIFDGFMDYFWSLELDISNFSLADRLPKSGNQLRFLIQRVPSGRTSHALSIPRRHLLQHLPFQDGSESHNRNLQAILTNGVVSCSTLSDQGYVEDFYD